MTSPDHLLLRRRISDADLEEIRAEIERMDLRRVDGRGILGPIYDVAPGDVILRTCPAIERVGQLVREELERFAGSPLNLCASVARAIRIQVYREPRDSFRWHFDGQSFAGIVTVENHSDGVTEIISRRWSRLLRFVHYAAYPFPRILSAAPRTSITCGPADLLMIPGGSVLHRARNLRPGRRTVVVYTFDEPGKRPARIIDRIVRQINFSREGKGNGGGGGGNGQWT